LGLGCYERRSKNSNPKGLLGLAHVWDVRDDSTSVGAVPRGDCSNDLFIGADMEALAKVGNFIADLFLAALLAGVMAFMDLEDAENDR
jgi:hypothetical protein